MMTARGILLPRKVTLAPLLAAGAVLAAGPVQADVRISTGQTQNMDCSGGTCIPTATAAVLNAGDLETYLSQFGNVRVMTTGNGVEAKNVVVDAAFSSPDSTSLTLDAHEAITINAAVAIGSGTSELELQSGKGGTFGTLSFGAKGSIGFGSLSDIFGINGGIFTLVNSVQGLAAAVAANPSEAFAFANSYDASQDGTYSAAPVQTALSGYFEGLGNTISDLRIDDETPTDSTGLFAQVGSAGTVADLHLAKVSISGDTAVMGSLVGSNAGFISGTTTSGKVKSHYSGTSFPYVGGLVGTNSGTITSSFSATAVSGQATALEGGLVGRSTGAIALSYATGNLAGVDKEFSPGGWAGGLVGEAAAGTVDQSFATGAVTGKQPEWETGGLIGLSAAAVTNCYATGNVSALKQDGVVGSVIGVNAGTVAQAYGSGFLQGSRGGNKGGFVGLDRSNAGSLANAYWDNTTTGVTKLNQGAGNRKNDPGITGLSDSELKSGLPPGFDPAIWGQNSSINNGWPYLLANPPPK